MIVYILIVSLHWGESNFKIEFKNESECVSAGNIIHRTVGRGQSSATTVCIRKTK